MLAEIEQNSSGGIDGAVAVLDTGIAPHLELSVVGGRVCIGQGTGGNGHGTRVAGTVGSRDNSAGVVGVVPAVRLCAVKVLGASGGGTTSSVICGLDWVAARADRINVAHLILSGGLPEGRGRRPVATRASTTRHSATSTKQARRWLSQPATGGTTPPTSRSPPTMR